jgi:hypothetical protein
MKIYRGKWKYARRHYWEGKLKLVTWALTLKPGDYFASCVGCNRQIKSIKVQWQNDGYYMYERYNKHWFINNIVLEDTKGRVHYVDSGGCALPAESNETIYRYFESLLREDIRSPGATHLENAVLLGLNVLDEHGELLPEFES